ncbi:CubicO group peptidase (beta-lactamase class C family) [Mucilaginibacter frigoritolerans]|uniref:CubicO group peptidase (Beta-lactamase class C family) n=1 Tax=Mucilaginibacter frigoritolerans TaxID=652788 RepID=A0A562U0L4_9SPHI|nr:serine hydrolase [Mucilaginibacter frigoritolerans]TWI99379.1 CubicO group peptidase (beta-lactamase class C family) [Mucilaginibacter frigoritolerans]
MRKNKCRLYTPILLVFILLNSACAQNPSASGLSYVKEEKLAEQSTILFNNANYLIPLQNLDELKVASIHFTSPYAAGFDSLLNKYTKVASFNGSNYTGIKTLDDLSTDLKWYNTLIVQLTDADMENPQIINFINSNQKIKNVVIALSGNSNSLAKLTYVTVPIIWTERVSPVAALWSAQTIFGGVAITQKLNRNISYAYKTNMGFITSKIRLQYTVPEDAGVNATNLLDIDNIASEAILERATPGCVVLVVKDGKVIFNKAYGYHTYDKTIPDKLTDIFDLASMTKISATTMETMQLVDQGRLNVDSTVGTYLPITRKTNKSGLLVRELLEHQAGLIPDIPTLEAIKPLDKSVDSSAAYPTKVNEHYYLRKDYFKDVMWPEMLNSTLKTRGQYVYSDLSMCYVQQIIETVTSTPENIYTQQQFYNPLGMQTAGFLPLYRFSPAQIVPTEDDQVYRHAVLDGYVHDPTAALMGGVAGHAGLFASANDVAILYQMVLNGGSYGGVQYIKPETITQFTAKQSPISRRGLGFDRWDPDLDHHYPSKLASNQAYGHTGFTGTCVWVDPKYNLVYIFLSNRVYPNLSSKLSSLNIRPRIQDVVYEAIQKGM